jgi:Mg2+ and Co2+ transporter CorA
MAATNLYGDLKNALNDFKTFLDANTARIAPAIKALEAVVPQISDLVSKLTDLMGKMKTEIQNLNVSGISGIDQVSKFTDGITTVLTTAKSLLKDQATAIQDVLDVTNVVTGLPTIDTVKTDILNLIDGIVADLNQLK